MTLIVYEGAMFSHLSLPQKTRGLSSMATSYIQRDFFLLVIYRRLCSHPSAQLSTRFMNEIFVSLSSDSTHCPCHKRGKKSFRKWSKKCVYGWGGGHWHHVNSATAASLTVLLHIFMGFFDACTNISHHFEKLSFAVWLQKDRYGVSEQALNDQNLFIVTYCVGSHPQDVCLDRRRCQNNLTF